MGMMWYMLCCTTVPVLTTSNLAKNTEHKVLLFNMKKTKQHKHIFAHMMPCCEILPPLVNAGTASQ